MKKLDPKAFAAWLKKQKNDKCGYLMGAVGQYTKDISTGSWLVHQYKNSTKQYKQAKYWLKNAPRVFDCQGLADCYLTEMLGQKVNVYARNNFSYWCNEIKGKGKIPKEYRVPGAAVFTYSANDGRITHVGFLLKPVDANNPEGDWYVIEARGVMYGVVRTKLSERSWNRWGLMDEYFDYTEVLAEYHGDKNDPEYSLGDRTLKKGKHGNDVKTLQELLIQIGYEVIVTGEYDEVTIAAITDFKKSEDLEADGVYGAKAHEALMRAIEEDEEDIFVPNKVVTIVADGTWNVRKGSKYDYISKADNGWIQIEIGDGTGWVSPKCAEV